MDTDPRTELARLRAALADLAVWGDDRLNDEWDRQYLAEHLVTTLTALLAGDTPPPAPF